MAKKEMKVEIVKGEKPSDQSILKIEIPVLKPLKPSKSGKTLVVATTHGNIPTEVKVDGKTLTVGLNAYIKND